MKSVLHTLARHILPESFKRRIVTWALKMDKPSFRQLAHDRAIAPCMDLGLAELKARHFSPRHVADIGAFHGEWTRMAQQIWPDAKLSMLEANPEKEPQLRVVANEIGADLHMGVLGPEDGQEVVFHIMETGSSVFPENSPLERSHKTLTTARLDTLMAQDMPDFVKIDVQGFEIEVLKGAQAVLSQAQGVLIEVSLIPTNKGAPFMSDVISFLKAHDFEVGGVLELHRRPLDKAVNQVDLMFVPRRSPLLSDTRHF